MNVTIIACVFECEGVWLLMSGKGFYSKLYVTDCGVSVPREALCKGCLSLELPGVPRQPGTFDQD